jgi:hypothetical protein
MCLLRGEELHPSSREHQPASLYVALAVCASHLYEAQPGFSLPSLLSTGWAVGRKESKRVAF